MIMQFVDVISRGDPVVNVPNPGGSGNVAVIRNFSDNRFFGDRILRPTGFAPAIARRNIPDTAFPESYIVAIKLNSATPFSALRLMTEYGEINSFTKGIVPTITSTTIRVVSIPLSRFAGKMCHVHFTASAATWMLRFGTEATWNECPAVLDTIGLIRVSAPNDERIMTLPRFVSGVRTGWNVLGGDMRGSVGQPFGRTINKLRTYTVEFQRVHADLIDEYFDRVSTTMPHWIVPYPGDVEHVPPIWGTLTTPPDMRKRNVNNWYFDLRLSWQEAY